MHDGEVDIDGELVGRLLAAQFPQWATLPLHRVPSTGTDNAMFRLGDDLVVRLPRIAWAAVNIEKEQGWLARLAPDLPVAVPVPVGRGVPAEGYPWQWSVCRWLEGENPVAGDLGDPVGLARDVAAFVDALRGIDPAEAPPGSRGGPLAERDGAVRAAIDQVAGIDKLRAEFDLVAVAAAWEAALNAPVWTGPPVLLHADISPGNLLCRDGRLTAVIDWSCLTAGDPACDLLVAWNLLPPAGRDELRHRLGVDDATWARGRGWALSVALLQLPYYHVTNPGLADNARHVIGEILKTA